MFRRFRRPIVQGHSVLNNRVNWRPFIDSKNNGDIPSGQSYCPALYTQLRQAVRDTEKNVASKINTFHATWKVKFFAELQKVTRNVDYDIKL